MIVWFLAAGATAAIDWSAVAIGRRRLESIAKPLVMVFLIVAAVGVDAVPAGARGWMIAGLAFGLLGDVFLLPHVDRFIEGLAAFLAGHVTYAIALALMLDGVEPLTIAGGCVVVVGVIGLMATPVLRAVRGHTLQIPVTVYMGAVVTVVMLGFATGRWPAAVGATIFAVSDGLLGANRFVEPAPQRRIYIHILYHLGQAGLVLSLDQSFA